MAFERRSGRPPGDTVFDFFLNRSRGIDGTLTRHRREPHGPVNTLKTLKNKSSNVSIKSRLMAAP